VLHTPRAARHYYSGPAKVKIMKIMRIISMILLQASCTPPKLPGIIIEAPPKS
jgi:hypothetical protein